MASQQGVDDLRHHRLLEADDSREQLVAGAELPDEVFADLVADAKRSVLPCIQLPEKPWSRAHGVVASLSIPKRYYNGSTPGFEASRTDRARAGPAAGRAAPGAPAGRAGRRRDSQLGESA